MEFLRKVAGRNICHLSLDDALLKHLPLFPRLKELHFWWNISWQITVDEETSPAFLTTLPELSVLHLAVHQAGRHNQGIAFHGLSALTQLTAVHALDALVYDLPRSVTELKITFIRARNPFLLAGFDNQAASFRGWFSSFRGCLSRVCLNMQPYDSDPELLHHPALGLPCLRDVSHLRLSFAPCTQNVNSRWCTGHFRQLQTLHLAFEGAYSVFCPVWDLSTCGKLRKLMVSIDVRHPERLCLSHITGVTADMFELELSECRRRGSPRFSFTSWSLSQVSINWAWECHIEGLRLGLPDDVSSTLGALLCMAAVPAITVNGLTPAAAAVEEAPGIMPQLWDESASDSSDD